MFSVPASTKLSDLPRVLGVSDFDVMSLTPANFHKSRLRNDLSLAYFYTRILVGDRLRGYLEVTAIPRTLRPSSLMIVCIGPSFLI